MDTNDITPDTGLNEAEIQVVTPTDDTVPNHIEKPSESPENGHKTSNKTAFGGKKGEGGKVTITIDANKDSALKHFLKTILKLVMRICGMVILAVVILNYVLAITIVHNTDNFPAVKDGDLVIAYRLTDSFTGDLVLYEENGRVRAGRICGVAGDEIDIPVDDIYYMVNGTIPYEVIYTDTRRAEKSEVKYPFVVPEGTYFILNDNRDETSDSREFGVLPKDNILGKVVLTIRRRGF